MGCASSSPLVEGGKNFIDKAQVTANDMVIKGEQTLHDVSETAKGGLNTGMETVKGAMESAMMTAENSIGTVVDKIGNTFNSTKSTAQEAANNVGNAAEDMANKATEGMAEAVSEAETVLASEAEGAKESMLAVKDEATDKLEELRHEFGEEVSKTKAEAAEVLRIEELDQAIEQLDQDIDDLENEVQGVFDRRLTPAASPLHALQEPEVKKEERTPTHWEKAADAILVGKLQQSFEVPKAGVSKPELPDHGHGTNENGHFLTDLSTSPITPATVDDTDARSDNGLVMFDNGSRIDVPRINIETSSLTSSSTRSDTTT